MKKAFRDKIFELAEENRERLLTISALAKVLGCKTGNLYLKINRGMKTEMINGIMHSSVKLHEEYQENTRRQGRPRKND